MQPYRDLIENPAFKRLLSRGKAARQHAAVHLGAVWGDDGDLIGCAQVWVASDQLPVEAQHQLGLPFIDDGGRPLFHQLPPNHMVQRQRPKALHPQHSIAQTFGVDTQAQLVDLANVLLRQ